MIKMILELIELINNLEDREKAKTLIFFLLYSIDLSGSQNIVSLRAEIRKLPLISFFVSSPVLKIIYIATLYILIIHTVLFIYEFFVLLKNLYESKKEHTSLMNDIYEINEEIKSAINQNAEKRKKINQNIKKMMKLNMDKEEKDNKIPIILKDEVEGLDNLKDRLNKQKYRFEEQYIEFFEKYINPRFDTFISRMIDIGILYHIQKIVFHWVHNFNRKIVIMNNILIKSFLLIAGAFIFLIIYWGYVHDTINIKK